MLNVLRVVIGKSEKLLQFFNHGQFWPGTYGLKLVRVRPQTTSLDNVPQVLNQSPTKETLLTFCKQLLRTQLFKYSMQVLHVLYDSGTK